LGVATGAPYELLNVPGAEARVSALSPQDVLLGHLPGCWFGRNRYVLILTAILLFAWAVRLFDVVGNPPGFYSDEAAYGVNAYAILHHGRDEYGNFLPFIFRSFDDYKLPFFIYAEVPFVGLLGRTVFAVRFTDTVVGCLTILAIYFLGVELFKEKRTGAAAAAFLAISPWHIHFSRTGFGEVVSFPLLLCLSILLFLKSATQPRLVVPAFMLFGLTLYTYRAAWPIVPPMLLVLAILYRQELWRARHSVLVGLLCLGFMVLPLAGHLLTTTNDRAEATSILHTGPGGALPRVFIAHYLSYFTPSFLFQRADNNVVVRHYLPGQGVVYWFELPLIVLGTALLIRSRRRPELVVLALLALFPLGGALSNVSPVGSRTLLGAVALALVAARGTTSAFDLMASRFADGRVIFAVFTTVALLSFGSYFRSYLETYPVVASEFRGWQYGGKQILDYFLSVRTRYDDLYIGDGFDSAQEVVAFYTGGACPECKTGGPEQLDDHRRQLFALRPSTLERLAKPYTVRAVVNLPDGRPGFVLVEPMPWD
jgi:4-amino-4-deoxy-L-arabinose transferase-like glycosyltransferase